MIYFAIYIFGFIISAIFHRLIYLRDYDMRSKGEKTMFFHGEDNSEQEMFAFFRVLFWPIALVKYTLIGLGNLLYYTIAYFTNLIDKFYTTWIKS